MREVSVPEQTCAPVVVYHKEDVDGIVSAAIGICVMRELSLKNLPVEIQLLGYDTFPAVLRNLFSRSRPVNMLIADLGMNEKIWDVFRNLSYFKKSTRTKKCNWLYYDHHSIDVKRVQKIKVIFDEYENATISDRWTENQCSAEMLYFHYKDVLSPHYSRLVNFAHIMDFKDESDSNSQDFQIATSLNVYISYHQQNPKKLEELVRIMADKFLWDEFIQNLDEKTVKINNELNQILQDVLSTAKTVELGGLKFIGGVSHFRAGWTSRSLLEHNLDVDIVAGLCVVDGVINIRSKKHSVMDILARRFGGGGHEDRAGFILPKSSLNSKDTIEEFPLETSVEILKVLRKLVKKEI